MNANKHTNKLTTIAFAISMLFTAGSALAAGNSITFDGEAGVDNGLNNAGKIDASAATNATVVIRQVNTTTGNGTSDAAYNVGTASGMNQVGDYAGDGAGTGKALIVGTGTVAVTIGQGAAVNAGGTFAAGATGSLNNIVYGKVSGADANADVRISQLGTAGAHAVKLGTGTNVGNGVTGGNLTITQSGNGNTVDIKAMSGGTVGVTQTGTTDAVNVTDSVTGGTIAITQETGTGQTVNIASATGGSLTVDQTGNTEVLKVVNQAGTSVSTIINQSGDNSTLTFDTGATQAATYAVTVNQTGAYQQTNLTYDGSGYTGTLNLSNHGTAAVNPDPATYATLDLKL